MSKTPAPDVNPAENQPASEAGFLYPQTGGSYTRNPDTGELTRLPEIEQEPHHAVDD